MQHVSNKEIDKWVRPWNIESFDNLSYKDERFFSILIKGVLTWLTKNVILYDKSIRHYIFNTGSSYMYVEQNGYEFKWCETTGDNYMYMEMPRCIAQIGNFSIPQEELTSPFVRGVYERMSSKDNQIKGYNAEIRRLPIEMTMHLTYILSNFNESIVLLQELFDKLIFQRYFSIVYLGQTIRCSIEFSSDTNIELNKIDMISTDVNQKNIAFDIKISTYYPIINTRTEMPNDKIIAVAKQNTTVKNDMI